MEDWQPLPWPSGVMEPPYRRLTAEESRERRLHNAKEARRLAARQNNELRQLTAELADSLEANDGY